MSLSTLSPEQRTVVSVLAASPYARADMIEALTALVAALVGTPREVALGHLAEYRSGYPSAERVAVMRRCWAVAA